MKLSAPGDQAEWLNHHLRSRVQASIAGTQYLKEYLDSGAGTPERNQRLLTACFNQAVWEGRHAALRWLIEFVGIQANAKWEAVSTMKRQATEDPSNAKLAEKMKKKRFDVDIMDMPGGAYFSLHGPKAKLLAEMWLGCTQATSHATHGSNHPDPKEPRLSETAGILAEHLQKTVYANAKQFL
jgi:hypothetical protein